MEEYNRDAPQAGSGSPMVIVTATTAGFLIGGSSCLVAAWMFISIEQSSAYAAFSFFATPIVATIGGLIGMWLALNRPKPPPS